MDPRRILLPLIRARSEPSNKASACGLICGLVMDQPGRDGEEDPTQPLSQSLAALGAPSSAGLDPVVLRVLLAEDEAFQRDSLEAIFEAANNRLGGRLRFELTQVSSAAGVLEALRGSTDWQLVLLDIYMPEVMGHEIIRDVQLALGDKVPVLMISAAAHMGAIHQCLRLGADMCAGGLRLQPAFCGGHARTLRRSL